MDDIDELRAKISSLVAEGAADKPRRRRVRSIQHWVTELGLDRLFSLYLRLHHGAETIAELDDQEIGACGQWIADLHDFAVSGGRSTTTGGAGPSG